MTPANDNLCDDVLKGADEIAEFIKEDKRAVFYAIKKGRIPHYRIGQNIRARKSTLTAWIASQEAGARASA
ncbi:excisionase family DNA binding protein [Shinella sp. BE166]|uniref:helix-turn-helix domain-containing protein n=1 Tax=Shinella sp. BE166 TaxID=3373918 RepID=UPI003EBF3B5F